MEAPLYIDDTAGLHIMDMHAKLRRLKSERKQLGLVIVDYLQLMSVRGRSENRNQEVSALSRGLKLLAKELNVPMMVLSQLSRAVETRQGDHRDLHSFPTRRSSDLVEPVAAGSGGGAALHRRYGRVAHHGYACQAAQIGRAHV